MKDKKYNRSFARKLTRWVMLVLLIMMGTLLLLAGYLLHYTTNTLLVIGLLFIVGGTVGYVQGEKRK